MSEQGPGSGGQGSGSGVQGPGSKGSNLDPGPWTLKSSGFTLIEVLLAVSILALVVAIIYASFSMAGRNVQHAEASRDRTDLARTLLSRITSDLHNATCVSGVTNRTLFWGRQQEQEIDGKKKRRDRIDLTTLTSWRRPVSNETDLWEIGYYFKDKPEGNGTVLMRREKRDLIDSRYQRAEGGTEYEVTDKVDELRLRYVQMMSASPVYEDRSWGSQTICDPLPWAVEVTLVLDDGSVYIAKTDIGIQRPR